MISIIIPVLNESATIGHLIRHLNASSTSSNITEIIIVDGGSTDGTLDIIRPFRFLKPERSADKKSDSEINSGLANPSKVILIDSPKGRAKQMNFGAKQACGSILYFLHADSFPPKHFDQLILSEVEKGNKAGCFRMQFESNHWWLCLASWFTQFNWKACRGGDQSLFITQELFNIIGGYNEAYGIYEDNILIQELYQRKQFTVINKKLQTSARLYKKHGVWKVQYHYFRIYIKRWFGASAEDLQKYYRKYFS
ncbi:MAG: TIGR04283 family arsenosugar biosynthesis glycosyltransferase [Winogradskyella sp.]|nr:TIGR04283 family arsenosugar biosynthesis glycosyltransferase [Winogradskyella sp.]